MCSGLVDRFGAIVRRTACVLAAALLTCASVAYGQVIEEGGFPVKGNGVSGEPFSLSCPSRLVAQAGESVSLSCSATAVPEEGVRYAWESLSGDGLHLLSDANERSPLFTAPSSGESAEYVYRLAAMSAGVYETATVTVVARGVSGETVSAPVVQEECGSFGGFRRDQEGCQPWAKAPSPDSFGGSPEDEEIVPWPSFPESPGAEDKDFAGSSGAGPFPQPPPRLECPAAVFLEELQTGAIECHAWDASGEEFLDYSWEPVGSTTRDYLDNPRLIPEDSPIPSVVAPEAPAYETLESFRSGETTFVYRYRLTATSLATGLSSSSEVEVFVSSSRPGVYCPLEVAVEEGATAALDCEGADPLSSRMDYDEDGASIAWEWEGLWGTSMAPLDAPDRSSPLFTAPAGSAGEEYHYIASMTSSSSGLPRTARRRVTVTVTGAEEGTQAAADASALANKGRVPLITCNDAEAYEATADFMLDCSVTDEPSSATYEWTTRGSTSDTNDLSSTAILKPTFSVPGNVDANTDYEYRVTMTVGGVEQARDDITITVKKKGDIACNGKVGTGLHGGLFYGTFASGRTVQLDLCSTLTGAGPFSYSWWGVYLSNKDQRVATFTPPNNVEKNTVYRYALTISSPNANIVVVGGGTWVYDTKLTCVDNHTVYEGDVDFYLNCSLTWDRPGEGPSIREQPAYGYMWSPRGDTPDTSLLIVGTPAHTPTFSVPDNVDADTEYEYRITISGRGGWVVHEADVTVTVLNRVALTVVCADPGSVYEGSADIAFDCSASGAPSGSAYAYAWAASGDTQDTSLLSAADIASPTFRVPDEVDENETYEYLLTVSAENAEDATAEVMVRVLNKPAIVIICLGNPYEPYEWDDVFDLDCVASGAPAGSEYVYVWTARGSTPNTDRLIAGTDGPTPTFDVPDYVDSIEMFKYTLAVSAENAEPATQDITVTVRNESEITVTCTPPSYMIFEGEDDFDLNCSVTNEPSDATYSWTGTDIANRFSSTTILTPTFKAPGEVDATTTYEYTLTVSAEGVEDGVARVTVTVKDKPEITVTCTGNPYEKYEGEEDFALDCTASGAPQGSDYDYVWTGRNGTVVPGQLSSTTVAKPTFDVPEEVASNETYEYTLTVSADNAGSATEDVTVTVLNRGALSVTCADPAPVYEGSEDFAFDCSASGAPSGSAYAYAWAASGDTQDTSLLSATDISSPTFYVPEEVDATTIYEYRLAVSAENAESSSARVTVTVLNRGALAVVCADPGSVYEGSADIAFDCSASGAPSGSAYAYAWAASGDTQDTSLLSATDISSPTFYVPEEVDATTIYEYRLTVSAENAESSSARVTVTVLNRGALAVVCAALGSVYEGSADIAFDCSASGAPSGSAYAYAWAASGDTQDTSLLSAADIASPTFFVPDEVDATTIYEYRLTVSAENAESSSARVTVTVLNRGALAVVCADPGSVYEGSADIAFDCSASGAPSGSAYAYAWAASGDTQDTSLLSAADISSPTFYVPEEVDEDETYEYLLTVSADNAEDASAEVMVTVLDRAQTPPSDPVSPPVDSPPLASSSAREPSDPSALGVTVSASPLRFGVQSSDTHVSLDPMTDQISTHVSGPYHAGRMTLSPGGSEENGEMDLSIELASPVVLRREGGIEAASLVLSPSWSLAESCEQLSSQAIGGLYTEVTLSDADCRLLLFGGELDLTDVPSGRYAGSMDIILRSGEREETHSVEVDVTVIPAQQVITIGPRGVRFSTSRELPAGLTEEQNLSIYPHVAFLTEEKPHGVFELSNPSLIPLEISVSARFGYTEATENGREVVVEDASGSHLGDLSQVVDIHPNVLVLQPGEKGLVRYGVQEGALAAVAERGYAAFFDVVSEPRQYVRSDQMPEEVSGDRTARVTMRVPGVYVPGEGASQLRAALSSISYVGSMSATFLLETQDHPFVGEVVAYDGDGRELGRRETLVYTRSRVRIPLDRMPEAGTVFLHFMPRGSDRVPEPASVEWDAPRRDIGATGNKDGATTTATLVQKP